MLNQRNTGPTCWLKGDSTASSVHVHTSNADFINRHAGTDPFQMAFIFEPAGYKTETYLPKSVIS